MIQKILEFLGGKPPKIFNKEGEVQHELGEKRWREWKERNQDNPEYNWKQHAGRNSRRKGS